MQDSSESDFTQSMETRAVESYSLENWFKLTFRLLVGDHWQKVAPLIINGDTTYRWCREIILNALRELECSSNRLLSCAISNVRGEIWKLRSIEVAEEQMTPFLRVSVWENTFAIALDLLGQIPEAHDKLRALKLAIIAGVFACREKTEELSSLKTKVSVVYPLLKGLASAGTVQHEDIVEAFCIFSECLEENGIATDELEKEQIQEGRTKGSVGRTSSWTSPKSWCFGDFGDKNGQLEYPVDVLVNGAGEFVVLEENSKGKDTIQRVQVFDKKGRYKTTLLQRGKRGISSMSDMALDNEGNVVVSLKDEQGVGRVNVYDIQGACVRVMDVIISDPGFPPLFTCVAVDRENRILVVEHNEMSIHVYGNDGRFLFKFGQWDHNAGGGSFDNVYSLNCSQNNEIYVCDPTQCVHVFDSKGTFARSFKPCGIVPSSLIVMEDKDLVYGVNRDAHALEAYSMDGSKVLRQFGGFRNELGKLWSPMGTALTLDGRIAVAEKESHRIQVVNI